MVSSLLESKMMNQNMIVNQFGTLLVLSLVVGPGRTLSSSTSLAPLITVTVCE